MVHTAVHVDFFRKVYNGIALNSETPPSHPKFCKNESTKFTFSLKINHFHFKLTWNVNTFSGGDCSSFDVKKFFTARGILPTHIYSSHTPVISA